MKIGYLISTLLVLGSPAFGLDLTLPANSKALAQRNTSPDSFDAPIGVFGDESVPSLVVEGAITRRSWKINSGGMTTLQAMEPLRDQIEGQGYDLVFECESMACGGFDFRFGVETLPAPSMYVNIRDYRYLTAFRGPEKAPEAVISVLVSTTASAVFIQEIQMTPLGEKPVAPVIADVAREPNSEPAYQPDLIKNGHVVLQDVEFASGRSELVAGPITSLDRLAETLKARPKLRIALVGHTDSVGSLNANIVLSKQRARAVRHRLITSYGIAANRIDAEGNGYLSPVASNLDPQGREANRRVEAVVLSEE